MKPTIGRIVHYKLSGEDVIQINRRRTDGFSISARIQAEKWPLGAQAHIGNPVEVDQVFPMIIVSVKDSGLVHGQVFLDGNDTLWTLSIFEGTAPGTWAWPPRV